MKQSVYKYEAYGTKSHIDLEIFLDINRELTETDRINIRQHVDNIIKSINEESIKLNPESKLRAEKEKEEIIALFGNRAIYVEEIPNGYCNDYCCKHLPWFIVTTNLGRIKIGWRKRVLHIEWSDSKISNTAEELFPNENVTKYDKVIHAWGYEKAKEYIDVLLK